MEISITVVNQDTNGMFGFFLDKFPNTSEEKPLVGKKIEFEERELYAADGKPTFCLTRHEAERLRDNLSDVLKNPETDG